MHWRYWTLLISIFLPTPTPCSAGNRLSSEHSLAFPGLTSCPRLRSPLPRDTQFFRFSSFPLHLPRWRWCRGGSCWRQCVEEASEWRVDPGPPLGSWLASVEVLPLVPGQATVQLLLACDPARVSLALLGLAYIPSLAEWFPLYLSVISSLLNTSWDPWRPQGEARPASASSCHPEGVPWKCCPPRRPRGSQIPHTRQPALVKRLLDSYSWLPVLESGPPRTCANLAQLSAFLRLQIPHLQIADDENSSLYLLW